MHSHYFLGKTSYDDDHWHNYEGMTSMDPSDPGHIHQMGGQTSLNDEHVHHYQNLTSPAIYINGKHYHMYCGVTDMADQHVHSYEAATDTYHDAYYEKCPPCEKTCK